MNKLVKILDKQIIIPQSLADMIFGAAVLALNLFLKFVGVNKYIADYGATFGIDARTLPSAVFLVAGLLGILLIIEGYGKYKKKDQDENKVSFHLISLAILLDMAIFVFTIKPLGYPIANFIMMIIMYWLSGGKSWLKGIIMSVIFTVVSVLFFYTYLKLSIPMGLLSFLIY